METTTGAARVVAIRGLRSGRARVTLDDGRELLLTAEACAREGLHAGTELDDSRLSRMGVPAREEAAHEAALSFLSHRARSAEEVRRRLARRGFDDGVIDAEIERLRRVGLLDDAAFARAWVAERERLAPRGRRLLRAELRQRGIGAEPAEAATAGLDDRETAMALARKRATRVHAADYRSFAAKVGGFLFRRGFDHETAEEAVRAAWAEMAPGDDTEGPEVQPGD